MSSKPLPHPATPLRFRPDGSFTVVQFTDLHFTDNNAANDLTTALMEAVLAVESPDLVMLTGDVIDGGRCDDPAAAWRRAVAPLVTRGVAWAAVFGNHDDEGTLDRAALMALQQTLPGCRSAPGPHELSGVGNYVLPVLAAQTERTAAHLYCLDSNAYAETAVEGYGWIRRDQIAWYVASSQSLAAAHAGERLPALAFFHIPLPEYDEVWDFHPCFGYKHEPVCCPRINTGLFAALHEMGEVMGVFVGHDHINDYMGELHGIRLAYGRGSGYNTYGRAGYAKGARVIRLTEGVRDFTTWLRLDDGSAITSQLLHPPEGSRTLSTA
jgi:hypothetical protein